MRMDFPFYSPLSAEMVPATAPVSSRAMARLYADGERPHTPQVRQCVICRTCVIDLRTELKQGNTPYPETFITCHRTFTPYDGHSFVPYHQASAPYLGASPSYPRAPRPAAGARPVRVRISASTFAAIKTDVLHYLRRRAALRIVSFAGAGSGECFCRCRATARHSSLSLTFTGSGTPVG